jgi:hypothetical protein
VTGVQTCALPIWEPVWDDLRDGVGLPANERRPYVDPAGERATEFVGVKLARPV